jgi:hypothetical protein
MPKIEKKKSHKVQVSKKPKTPTLSIMLPDTKEIVPALQGQKDWFTHWENNGKPYDHYFPVGKHVYGMKPLKPQFKGTDAEPFPFYVPHLSADDTSNLYLLIPGEEDNKNRYVISRNKDDLANFKTHLDAHKATEPLPLGHGAHHSGADTLLASGKWDVGSLLTEKPAWMDGKGGKTRKTRRHKTRKAKTRKSRKSRKSRARKAKTRRHKTRKH